MPKQHRMGKKTKREAYIVFQGRCPGIYNTWEGCEAQVTGFSGAEHQGYDSLEEAEIAWEAAFSPALNTTPRSYMNTPEAPDDDVGDEGSGKGNSSKRGSSELDMADEIAASGVPVTRSKTRKSKDLGRGQSSKRGSSEIDTTDEIAASGPVKKRKTRNTKASTNDDEVGPVEAIAAPETVKTRMPRGTKAARKDDEVGPAESMEPLDAGEIRIVLTAAQQAVVDMAYRGDNIFLTGAAGSGKSATLKEILRRLERKYRMKKGQKHPSVQVTAPTGIAALPLKGRTTWSFAGWNLNSFKDPVDKLLESTKTTTSEAMRDLRVLIIEEISMVENHFLERLDMLMRHVCKTPDNPNPGPFGDKQVIIVGDFHQLPPVKPFETCIMCGEPMKREVAGPVCNSTGCPFTKKEEPLKWGDKWAFKAKVWERLNLKHVKLEQIHRQKDTGFQSMLNKIRNGITLTDFEWKELERKKDTPKGITAIRLMSKLIQVRNFNMAKLAAINSPPKTWKAIDLCTKLNQTEEDKLDFVRLQIERKKQEHLASLKDHRFQENLTLKAGAKVVLLYNLDIKAGLVNGSQGEVIAFVDTSKWSAKEEETENGKWRSERVAEFTEADPWRPIVRFTMANGGFVTKAIPPIASSSLRGTSWDRYMVCRTQIPLTLGWALSIHKSQGMTLEHVELSSRDIFETGQLYVGLSRATTLQGLTVTGLNRKVLEMDPDVLAFYGGVAKWVDLGQSNKPTPLFGRKPSAAVKGAENSQVGAETNMGSGNAGPSRRAAASTLVPTPTPTAPALSSQASLTSKLDFIDLTEND